MNEKHRHGQAVVEGIFHPVINVSNMAEALKFYGDLLGLRKTFDDTHDPGAIQRLFGFEAPVVRSVVFECADGTEFELTEYAKPKGRQKADLEMNDAGIVALALRVSGIEELSGRVEAAGYRTPSGIVKQVLPDGATLSVAVCIGPDSVKVILVEPPAGRRSLGSVDEVPNP